MKKQIFLLLVALLFATTGFSAVNKAYVTLKEAPLYILNESGSVKETLPDKVAKGDTVFATPETVTYLEEHKGERTLRIPIDHKGTRAYIYVNNIHPIRLEPSDTLVYLNDNAVKQGSFKDQKIVPAMEWAMNVTTDPIQWIYLALIAIGCAVVFRILANIRGCGIIGLSLVGLSLAVMSAAEIMYFLSYEPHAFWFLISDIVGGWGKVLLNFLILTVVSASQAYLFYDLWSSSFTVRSSLTIHLLKKDYYDGGETPKWIVKAAYLPFIFGIMLIILIIFEVSATIYYVMAAGIVCAAIAGAIYQFSKGRLIPGIIFPLFYVADSIGLIVMVMSLGLILLFVAIVGAIFLVAISFILSFLIGVVKGPQKVTFVDQSGRVHTGSRYVDGTAKSHNDGKFYKLDD
ncbi:MAG: hypothetical protein K2M07_05880 [Muribaculaceae bacterium]|nr:hypothetical protein [Muribaculaceae bacterium]